MNRRVPFIVALAGVLLALAVPAVVAAAGPQLATSTIAGREIDITGTGFPASTDVHIAIQRNGGDAGSQTVRSDASGGFTAVIPAGPGRGGQYIIVATAGTAKAQASVVAVETAGAGGGTQPSAPATDTVPAGQATGARQPALTGALVLFIGGLSLVAALRRYRPSMP